MTAGSPLAASREGVAIERRDLYGTPLAVAVLPDCERINPALTEEVAALCRETGSGRPALGGAVSELAAAALVLVAGMTGDEGDEDPERWGITACCHLLSQGGSIAIHSHARAAWEATYLVEVSGRAEGGSGGELEFQDPRGAAPVMYAPNLTFLMPDGAALGVSRNIAVKPGLLAVYPAWLLHGVSHYRADGRRLSVTLRFTRSTAD